MPQGQPHSFGASTLILPFRRTPSPSDPSHHFPSPEEPPLSYSWILTSRLAIGPMPRSLQHWQQLEEAGFRSRFSCCYCDEEVVSIPAHWSSDSIALPDHREQEPMLAERLELAIASARFLLESGPPVYLHCWAGRERSPLVAVGVMAHEKRGDLFEALEWVRRCHPQASPLYGHLELLDQILRKNKTED